MRVLASMFTYSSSLVINSGAGIPFLCGGSSGWTANFDWLLKEENYLKIVEGTFYGGFESKKREYGFNDNELMFRIHAAEKQGESVPF